MKARSSQEQDGFVLLEVMIAVAIFAIAILTLGRSVESMIGAQVSMEDGERARQFLENRMAEIEFGAVQLSESSTEDLKGAFAGMKLKTTRKQLKRKDEKGRDIPGLYQVNLDLSWKLDGTEQARALSFYFDPRLQPTQ